jgi:hypothetical protein
MQLLHILYILTTLAVTVLAVACISLLLDKEKLAVRSLIVLMVLLVLLCINYFTIMTYNPQGL